LQGKPFESQPVQTVFEGLLFELCTLVNWAKTPKSKNKVDKIRILKLTKLLFIAFGALQK